MTTTPVEHRSTGWTADDSTFGARLALIRQRMGWGNVKEAAIACGLPTESWRTWERDNVNPRKIVEITLVISERTGCNRVWLLLGRKEGVTQVLDPVNANHPLTTRPIDHRPPGRAKGSTGPMTGSRPRILPRPFAA